MDSESLLIGSIQGAVLIPPEVTAIQNLSLLVWDQGFSRERESSGGSLGKRIPEFPISSQIIRKFCVHIFRLFPYIKYLD